MQLFSFLTFLMQFVKIKTVKSTSESTQTDLLFVFGLNNFWKNEKFN